jgi:hypothetical protein
MDGKVIVCVPVYFISDYPYKTNRDFTALSYAENSKYTRSLEIDEAEPAGR